MTTVDVVCRGGQPELDGSCHQSGLAETGRALLEDNQFQGALTILQRAAALGDKTPTTMLNLAIAQDRTGDRAGARALMRTIANRLPLWDEPVLRIAESLRAENDFAGAEDAYRQVLELQPNRPAALIALSGLLLSRGEPREARKLMLHCCGVAPNNAEAWYVMALALRATNEPGRALSAIVQAQALNPNALQYVLIGTEIAMQAEEGPAELARLELWCDEDPLNYVPLAGKGFLLDHLGQRDDAIDALEAATVLAPEEPVSAALLGRLLARTTRLSQAEAALRRACGLDSTNTKIRNDHAVILMKLHRHAEARSILLALEEKLGPNPSILCNLANSTAYVGLQEEALTVVERAIAADPTGSLPRRTLCNVLPYRDGTTAMDLLDAYRNCASVLSRNAQPPFANDRDPGRKLTLGLLSGSFRSHPVGWLTVAGIETLDREAFDLICLTRQMPESDAITRRFRSVSKEWLEVERKSDAELLALTRDREVDILIDLGGYGEGGRMLACADRLAPVQIKWVGMQNHSSGLPEMDWFLTDRWETPPALEPLYSERMLRMPDGYVCYSPPPHAPDVVPAPVLRNGFVTFGCFNNIAKITPRAIETWCGILRATPNSRLVLKTHQLSDAATAARFQGAFDRFGIDSSRVELRGSSPHRLFLASYNEIDLVLDPFPYSGGLTTCEALWMGVPTVTLPGEIFASRHSVSHLSNAGYADWVARDLGDYRAIALRWARDPAALARLRETMRAQVRGSPLCDAPRFGRALGAALRHAWMAE